MIAAHHFLRATVFHIAQTDQFKALGKVGASRSSHKAIAVLIALTVPVHAERVL